MSKSLLGLGIVICLLSCKKNLGDLELSNGTENRTRREIHNYTYNKEGRILTDNEITYYLLRDEITDTTMALSEYTYEKDRLVKITVDKDIPELTFTKIFKYNSKDSLTLELRIEHNGDTTYIRKMNYDGFGNKVLDKTRRLWNNRTIDDIINKPNKISYDTSFTWFEYDFEANKHTRTRAKNKFGEVESETQFFYENGKKTRGANYNFLGTIKYLQSTQTFDYSKYPKGEYQTIDKDGLPVESFSVEIRNGKLYKSIWTYNHILVIQFFDDSGKKIKDLDFSMQRVSDYKYDNRGNKIEIFEFPMPDSEFNTQYKVMTKILESVQN